MALLHVATESFVWKIVCRMCSTFPSFLRLYVYLFFLPIFNSIFFPCTVPVKKQQQQQMSADPPPSPPQITGVQDGGHTEGEALTLSCSVTGGQPPVRSINFLCAHAAGDSVDTTATVNGVTTLTSNVTFDRLDSTMNGTMCQCSGHWLERPSLYTEKATATIVVNGVCLCTKRPFYTFVWEDLQPYVLVLCVCFCFLSMLFRFIKLDYMCARVRQVSS